MRSLFAVPFASLVLLTGCADDPPRCEDGTRRAGDRCVPEGDAAPGGDARPRDPDARAGDARVDDARAADARPADARPADAAPAADAWEPDSAPARDAAVDAAAGDGAPDAAPAPDDRPDFPDTIDRLSFAVRTGGGENAGSDGIRVELCLNDARCFPLDVPDVNDFRRGKIDVYHFDDVALPRADVDRVELRWTAGADAWQPACVEVRFDGEAVHCRDGMTVRIGDGPGERTRWRDPDGLHAGCTTCYPSRLTHGPLVGAVGPDTARVLVRTDATRPVTLHVAEAAGGPATAFGPRYPSPRDDYTTVFDLDGLRPRTRYTADVHVGNTRLGRAATFRTAPRAGAASAFRVAFGSCANDTNFPTQPIFAEIDRRDPDLMLFLGDNHYGNTGNLQALWWRYRGTLEMPARAALLASAPTLATWDDHDFTGNNSDRHAAGRDRALRAFADYWANPAYGTRETRGVFFETSYGDVDFFFIDDRYHRDRPGTDGGSILGAGQHAWLEDALRRSTATFRVIASGSIFSRGGGETWLDYPASRDRLFRFLRANDIGGVVFLAGDVHRSHFRWIHRAHYDIPELVSSGLATHQEGTCPGRDAAEPDAAQTYCTQAAPTFMQLDFDTTRDDPRIVARIIDGGGRELRTMTILRSQLR